MAQFIFCISNPSIPGTIRIDKSDADPRDLLLTSGSSQQPQRTDWIVRVADARAALNAIDEVLMRHKDASWSGHYQCSPGLARSVAMEFKASEDAEPISDVEPTALPSLVLGLGLAVQFLGITNGQVGMSAALIAAALYWVVYKMPSGSGGQQQAGH